jgi:hypothetical protein
MSGATNKYFKGSHRGSAALVAMIAALAGCASAWRENATSQATGCAAQDVTTSDRHAGAVKDTWTAQCGGRTYYCSVSSSDENAAAHCEAADGQPVKVIAPVPEPTRTPPAGLEQKLQTLKQVYDKGLITQQEYDAKRKALLDSF